MQMTTSSLLWPTKDEYNFAISQWTQTLSDPDLRNGQLARDQLGICRFGGANLYVCVYKIGNWMVRCFCSNPPNPTPYDICDRYKFIDQFCRMNVGRVSALVPVIYIENGIAVGRRVLPVVKMPFLVGCLPLGEFIMERYSERITMWRLSEAWLRMIGEMEAIGMAHGDLDLTNVLVEERGPDVILRLIDYDNVWIPALDGRPQTEYGHAAFQHPYFLPPRPRPYNAEMDRFSALVIYISLKMLIGHPELYERWGADESDRLLLSETDYKNAGLADSRIMQMRNLADQDLQPYILELYEALRECRMPRSLDEIARTGEFIATLAMTYRAPQQTMFVPQPAPVQRPAVASWQNAVYTAGAGGVGATWMLTQQPPPPQPSSWGTGTSTTPLPSKPGNRSAGRNDDAGNRSPLNWVATASAPTQPWGTSGPPPTQLWGVGTPRTPLFAPPPTAYYQSAQASAPQQKSKRMWFVFTLLLLAVLVILAILYFSGTLAHISGQQAELPGTFQAVTHTRSAFLFSLQGIS